MSRFQFWYCLTLVAAGCAVVAVGAAIRSRDAVMYGAGAVMACSLMAPAVRAGRY